jgi:hypothetical protein
MDAATRIDIARQIRDAKAKIPDLEKDIQDAKKAGLGDVVRTQEETLEKLKAFLVKLEAVYGA